MLYLSDSVKLKENRHAKEFGRKRFSSLAGMFYIAIKICVYTIFLNCCYNFMREQRIYFELRINARFLLTKLNNYKLETKAIVIVRSLESKENKFLVNLISKNQPKFNI